MVLQPPGMPKKRHSGRFLSSSRGKVWLVGFIGRLDPAGRTGSALGGRDRERPGGLHWRAGWHNLRRLRMLTKEQEDNGIRDDRQRGQNCAAAICEGASLGARQCTRRATTAKRSGGEPHAHPPAGARAEPQREDKGNKEGEDQRPEKMGGIPPHFFGFTARACFFLALRLHPASRFMG